MPYCLSDKVTKLRTHLLSRSRWFNSGSPIHTSIRMHVTLSWISVICEPATLFLSVKSFISFCQNVGVSKWSVLGSVQNRQPWTFPQVQFSISICLSDICSWMFSLHKICFLLNSSSQIYPFYSIFYFCLPFSQSLKRTEASSLSHPYRKWYYCSQTPYSHLFLWLIHV